MSRSPCAYPPRPEVREVELWERLNRHLGEAYAPVWAEQVVIAELGGRTVLEALAARIPSKDVWRAVWANLELPDRER